MFRKRKTEVLIVGAGPAGLFAALELAARGIDVEIIDCQWRTAAHSYALALHPGSLELLDELGLAEELLEHGHRIDSVALYDGQERQGEIELARLSGKFPFVLVLPQQALEDALEARLEEQKIHVLWNHRLTRVDDSRGDRVVARVDKLIKEAGGYAVSTSDWVTDKSFDIQARFVIGADGLHSAVRRTLGIDFHELRSRQFFGVFEFETDLPDENEMRVVLDEGTTNVLWPMGNGHFRWSFELEDSWEFVPNTRTKSRLAVQIGEDTFPMLSREKLDELVSARAPWFDAEIGDVTWSVAVRFEHRLAASFGHGHVWLLGDAAHVTAPVGVQSMNVGFREARDLATAIDGVLHNSASPVMLEGYAMDRRKEWRALLGLESDLHSVNGASEWVQARSGRIVPCLPASGGDLRQLLGQIGLDATF